MIYFILRYPAVFIGFWRDSNKYLRDHKLKFILFMLLFCSCGYGQYPHPLTYKHTTKADSVRYYHKLVEFRDRLKNCKTEKDFDRFTDSCNKYWQLINPAKPHFSIEDSAICCLLFFDSLGEAHLVTRDELYECDSSFTLTPWTDTVSYRTGQSIDIGYAENKIETCDGNGNNVSLANSGKDTTLEISGDTAKAVKFLILQADEYMHKMNQARQEADWWKKAAQALEKVMEDLPADKPKPTPF